MDAVVRISSDSTCDLPGDLVAELGITLAPLYVNFGGKSLKDGLEATPQSIFDHVAATGELPSTSAVPVADYQELFSRLTADGSPVVHFSLGSGFSSSYQNACLAAEDFPDVQVVDTRHLSGGSGLIVYHAAREAREGADAQAIVAAAQDRIPRVETSFLIDKLDYLRKGGRCSAAAAVGANLLQLKPSIILKDCALHVGKKYRGSFEKCLHRYIRDHLQDRQDIQSPMILTSSGCSEELLQQVRGWIAQYQPSIPLLESVAGCTISAHCGPGTLGILLVHR